MADFDRIYRQNADVVYRFLLSMTGSADLAEELTQETFYQAVKSIGRYQGNGKISSWLCGIARNVLLAYRRKARREEPLPEEEDFRQYLPSAEETFLRKEEAGAVLEAIQRARDPGREILRLRIFGGLSFQQIGDILGHTETWARVNYYRAKQMIVKELKPDE